MVKGGERVNGKHGDSAMKLETLIKRYLGEPSPPKYTKVDRPSSESISVVQSALPLSIDDWPTNFKEAYEERAAILEFDEKMSRADAEIHAKAIIRERFNAINKKGYDQNVS